MKVESSLSIMAVEETFILAEKFLQFNVRHLKSMKKFTDKVNPKRLIVLLD